MGSPAVQDTYEYEFIETDINSLCRICGNVPEMPLVSIYSERRADNLRLAETIMNYLPIKVSPDDDLPVKICTSCSEMVEKWHSFYMCCVEADKKFQTMLLEEKEREENCFDQYFHNRIGKETPVNTESAEVYDGMDVSSIAKEQEAQSDEFGAYTEPDTEEDLKTSHAKPNSSSQHLEVLCRDCISQKIHGPEFDTAHAPNYREISQIQCRLCCKQMTKSLEEIECQICGETFSNKLTLRQHVVVHREITCYECNKSFKNYSNLVAHIKLHQGLNQAFVCPVCGLSMNRKYNMLIHISSHTVDFPCRICCASFNSDALLDQHKLTHVAEDIEKYHLTENKVDCSSCEELFDSRYKLYIHTLAEHTTDERKVVCHCGKIFETELMLKNHQKSHTDALYKCKICSKKFRQLKGLEEHQNTHLDNRPYQCETCGKKFRYSSNLSQHRTIHKGIRNFTCPQCGKKFLRSNTLATHLRSHRDIRKHVCPFCNAAFIQSSSLLKHKRTMHRSCDWCGKVVGNRTQWQIHVWKKCTASAQGRLENSEKPT